MSSHIVSNFESSFSKNSGGNNLYGSWTWPCLSISIQVLSEKFLLDKIQKGVEISHKDFKRLKALGLVEGRYPRIFVSGSIAAATGDQASHIRNKGFDNEYYRDLIEKLISEHGPVTPEIINALLTDKLPESMTDEQKRKKIRNLTQDLAHRRETIENIGNQRGKGALWRIRTNS